MRPDSIRQFDRYFLASLAIALVNSVLSYQDTLRAVRAEPAAATAGLGGGSVAISMAAALLVPLALWYLISRRGSNIAKWVLTALTVLGVVMMLPSLGALMQANVLSLLIVLTLTALQIFAVSFLFRADARAWLAGVDAGRADSPDRPG